MSAGSNSIAGDRLKSFIERIERLDVEKKEIADQIKEVFAEAKAEGFSVATMKDVIKLRKMEVDERQMRLDQIDLYMHALGMLSDTPLGQSAMRRAGLSGTA
jgi:uncharacterized protein (UPF0335 family)